MSRTVSPASGTSGRKRIRERANGAVYTRCPGLTPTDWPNWVRPAACPSCRRVLLWQVERLSPLRTDSLPFVSKIYWPKNADDAIMDVEPIGFAKFAPALREDPGGCESADHPKIARTTEGRVRSKSLFGSGLTGLGPKTRQKAFSIRRKLSKPASSRLL